MAKTDGSKTNRPQNYPETDMALATDNITCAVASPLKFDGKRYGEGDSVTLPLALYEELKAAGVVTAPDPVAAAAEKPAA